MGDSGEPTLLAGRYRYRGELGRGASGRVLLVDERHEGGTRAIKVVPRRDAERLQWERALLDRIAHPGLARVHELLTIAAPMGPPWSLPAGALALVEEHVEGVSAAEAIASVPEERRGAFAVLLGARIARALGAIHGAGLVHGDVKPANVVVPGDPAGAKLIDLGLARPAGQADTLSGTIGFLAPEALLGERSAMTDLYALGATLHGLLLGKSAYDTEASAPDLSRALARRPRVADLPEWVPISLRRLIGDLLAERPEERPSAAREVALRLEAVAEELGVAIEDAPVSDAPLPIERAARARVRPLVGRDAELRELTDRLREPGVVAVVGPADAGRTRLVREAVRAVQAEGAPAPTYLRREERSPPSRLDHDAVVHLEGAEVDWTACADAADAAAVQGIALRVVAEVDEAPRGVATVRLGPLDDAGLRTLLAELLEVDPSTALLEAGKTASGALPGRLCRLVAEAFEAGLDPSRPTTLADLGRREGDVTIPASARPLAEVAAVAGGAIAAAPAEAALDGAAEQAHQLIGSGLATLDARGRVTLRDDLRRTIVASLSSAERAKIAARIETPTDPLARAHLDAALSREGAAAEGFRAAMDRAREDGDPERAASIGRGAMLALDDPPFSIVLATADALRAVAREGEALALLEGRDEPAAVDLRAELARLLGDAEAAAAELGDREDPTALTLRAHLALGRGEVDEAAASLDRLGEAELDPRAEEIRAFVALSQGRFDEAARAARRGWTAARRAGDVGAEARACSVEGTVLQATGRVHEASARFERAFELADRAGERYAAASYLVNVGLGRLERGEAGPAIEALREGARRLTELGRRQAAARVLYNLGNAAALVGDDVLARAAIERSRREEARDPHVRGYASLVSADLDLRAGKLEKAAETLEAAWRSEGLPETVRVTLGARRAAVLAVRGEQAEARSALEALDGLSADRFGEVMRDVARSRVSLARGDFDEAARWAGAAITSAEGAGWECRLRASLVAAEAFERAGRADEARAASANARALLDIAAATLGADARARLRSVSAYQRALTVAPTESTRVVDRVTPRYRELARHAKALVREPRPRRLYEAIVDAAVELADAERGFLVWRADDGSLDLRSARAFGADIDGERPSRSVAARVLDTGRALVTVDALEDDRLDAAASVHAMALRSVLAVPVPLRGGQACALVLDDRLRPGAFDEAIVGLITDLAEVAAGAIERAIALQDQRREARRLAREKRRLSERVESAEQELSALRSRRPDSPFGRIVAQSEPMRAALHLVERVAAADAPVLVLGESGTGKELVARALHEASSRAEGPYVSENCSAIPQTLLESTLFGHVRGAFTGADRAKRGLFEIADGGTLFLDEIGEMSASMQAKLLRVLQDGELRPIGSERTRRVDVRLVSATHRDLPAMVDEGAFRRDLFYRIAVVQVPLPPLRERPDDVAPLVAELLGRHAGDRAPRVEPAALAALRGYAWPGNVRELENELRRALLLADDVIRLEHLSPAIRGEETPEPVGELDLKGQVDALERRLIIAALDRHDGNQTRAARTLGVSRYGLQKMMKRLDVPKP